MSSRLPSSQSLRDKLCSTWTARMMWETGNSSAACIIMAWVLSQSPSKGKNEQIPDLPRKAANPKAHWRIVYCNGIQLWVELNASKPKLASMLVCPSASHLLTLMPVCSQALSLSPESQDISFATNWDHKRGTCQEKAATQVTTLSARAVCHSIVPEQWCSLPWAWSCGRCLTYTFSHQLPPHSCGAFKSHRIVHTGVQPAQHPKLIHALNLQVTTL